MPDLFSTMKPIFGALFFEHENAFCEPLNGPLWYLPAILFMHILIDLCRKTKHQHIILTVLCIASYFIYAANKYWNFLPNLTFIGIISRLPFYYIGYVIRQTHCFESVCLIRDLLGGLSLLLASFVLFYWHLQLFYSGDMSLFASTDYLLHIGLFYPVNICFAFGSLYLCKVLDNIYLNTILNLSIGTLVIIGIHTPIIGIVNHALINILHINTSSCYQWHTALLITTIIVTLIYPLIIWSKQYAFILLGKVKMH